MGLYATLLHHQRLLWSTTHLHMKGGDINLLIGWIWALAGIVAGAIVGLFFHRADWAGGYTSFRRRMLRLAHISFFGLGFLNLLYAATLRMISLADPIDVVASIAFVSGAVTMPACCYLTAWRKPFRHLFPIPVLCTAVGVCAVLIGWSLS